MARRNVGGEDADYAAFLASRQQQTDPRMAMALQIMGLMEKQRTGAEDRALEEQKQKAQEMYQSGQLGLEREKLGVSKTEAEAAAREREATRAFQEGATTRDIQYKMDQAGREAEKAQAEQENKNRENKATAIWRLVNEKVLLPEEGKAQFNQLYPENVGVEKGLKESARQDQIATGLAKYQKATPKEREALAKNPAAQGAYGPPDVYDEILKQAGVNVAQPGAPTAGGLSGGIQDVLWNLPGGVENIFRGISNVGAKAWYGGNAPQYSYVPWTGANEEIPKYLGEGPPVAPPPAGPIPRPQYGNYGVQAGPAEAPPEWQYGVGQQRPPAPLNDLLAKALQNQ